MFELHLLFDNARSVSITCDGGDLISGFLAGDAFSTCRVVKKKSKNQRTKVMETDSIMCVAFALWWLIGLGVVGWCHGKAPWSSDLETMLLTCCVGAFIWPVFLGATLGKGEGE